ncbi:MAG: N-6 DNA methylase [Candidatus Kapaibacteriales bacterium]
MYSDTEIRIYNCSEKPLIISKEDFDFEKELQKVEIKAYDFSDKQQLEELNRLFSRVAIDTGTIWTLKEAKLIRDKIKIQRRVDKYLVSSLVNTANKLEEQGLKKEFIHKIILRSLFLLYLEDRGATDDKLYSLYKKDATSYFNILDDVQSTYSLFKRLEKDFNGNIFTIDENEKIREDQLQLIKKCFISGKDNTQQNQLFENWRLFDFSIIQIELLSEIYENFLSRTNSELKKDTGTYYTPPSLVEFILNDKLPINKNEKNYKIKILDPSCGSGIFLVESFKRLVKRYESYHEEKLTDFNKLKQLLTDNIFGFEFNPQAIKVAAFSLYLALVDHLDPKTLWQEKKHRLPYLINDPEDKELKIQGKNLYRRDTIEIKKDIDCNEYDLIVGNPPFGTRSLPDSIIKYCDKEGFAKEMVLPFLHKATTLAPNGDIALIFNSKVLTNTGGTYQSFRKWLFEKCYVKKVFNFSILRNAHKNFGGQLFGDATGPISIVYYQKEFPEKPNDKIAYYAPKTFIKSNIIDGLSIDFTDLKYLPREECQKPDTKIWKVAMWGGMNDWVLVNKLLNQSYDLAKFINKNKIKNSVGIQPLNKSTAKPIVDNEISEMKFIRPEKIERYLTTKDQFTNINSLLKNKDTINIYLNYYLVQNVLQLPRINIFRRVTGKGLFKGPLLLAKEGFKDNKLCFSFTDNSVAFNSTVLGLQSDNKNNLRFLSSLLNSQLTTYFLLLISNSWGIERERIKPNEVYKFPVVINDEFTKELISLQVEIEGIIKSSVLRVDYSELELKINKIIFDYYRINLKEAQSIEDFINYSVDLFHKKEKSTALHPVLESHISDYSETIEKELNEFLGGQDTYVNATIYDISRYSPLMMIKLSHDIEKIGISSSNEHIDKELKKLDQYLWEEKSSNIYFRKKLNYRIADDVFIIRPNQRRFWSKSMAIEDASELILEILNENS